ncbi:MAG: hypothetical protein J0L70_23650 [Leptolyngbya sp. UWPOB_LEPTO1]|uniref:hypothetical protein n=1 Tax=Leptolyngbya sp. UWPOB_LEPTO1 TaxID=2815653 RepID=UPI001AD01AC8|nr:hypothetical protein [Leptolyngbya sp. UWPOB_LEPTO1]MBN8563538.1 hypothetical protein [Leptolyngbya sp. UWPOB_LEPTO1]
MRISLPLTKTVAGNVRKHDSYREAWERIRAAQENNFFLEAITIQESIISDRLISYLSGSTVRNPLCLEGKFIPFKQLIDYWRAEFPEGITIQDYPNLIEAVDQWRVARNKAVHAIVKSEPGQPTQPIDVFLEKAKAAAVEGERLTKEVCKWRNREKTKERRSSLREKPGLSRKSKQKS